MAAQVEYLTPGEAADVLGMSRPAFLKHVNAGHIQPDNQIGSRDVFSRQVVERFKKERRQNGAAKRGPAKGKGGRKPVKKK